MQRYFFFAALVIAPLTFFAPSVDAAPNCPVNNSCCYQPIQQCTANGKDTNCPAGFQWCYAGICVSEKYDPTNNTCPQTNPSPTPFPTSSPSENCPVNNSCCSQNLQKCSGNGYDTSCPSGYRWCYSGYCINENYNSSTNTCPVFLPTPAPSVTPSPVPTPSPNPSFLPTPKPTVTPIPTPFPTPNPVFNEPLGCPVSGRITVPYGYNIIHYSGNNAGCTGLARCHNGIDIAAITGTAITSTLDGTVTASTWDAYKGNYITVTNPVTNISAVYEHMNSLPILKWGDKVKRGQILGFVGKTGIGVTGPHVHYKLLRGSTLLNPFRFVKITDPDPLLMMTSDSLYSNNYRNLYPLGAGHNTSNWGLCLK